MSHNHKLTLNLLICLLFAAACMPQQANSTPGANLPNPASVHCEENGGTLEIRTDSEGGQYGMCVFQDGSECEEWAFFRGECSASGQVAPTEEVKSEPTGVPTSEQPSAPAFDPAEYQGWWTYTHASYGFSIMLPPDWVVEEVTTGDPLMNGHLLNLHPQHEDENLNIRMTFRRSGEDVMLWPTGVGAGEFDEQGTLDINGMPARRVQFVCPTGQVQSIWYHGESGADIQLGELEFGFIYSYTGIYCEGDYSLGGKIQRVGDMVIASLHLP